MGKKKPCKPKPKESMRAAIARIEREAALRHWLMPDPNELTDELNRRMLAEPKPQILCPVHVK
jgi:hypothetical protein